MNPKISIIVPVYNVERYLDRCMQTLLGQTLRDIEIIMVDDGSPDSCPQMCDEYAKRDSRIKIIHKANAGLGYARNSGLEIATGEYVAFVDSDDYLDVQMYEILYHYAQNKNDDVVFCGFKKEFSLNRFLNVSECSSYTEYTDDEIKKIIPDFIASPPYAKNEYVHDMSVWHSIYRREIIAKNNIRFVSERDFVSEDIPFQIDFLKCCKRISFIPDILYTYCYNQGSLTKSFNISKFDKIKALYKLLCEKTFEYDNRGLRAKRLLLGYARAMIRLIITLPITKNEKSSYIKRITQDNVWSEIKKDYKLSYLPLHQRLMALCIYNKLNLGAYYYAHLMNIRILTLVKKWGGNLSCFIL